MDTRKLPAGHADIAVAPLSLALLCTLERAAYGSENYGVIRENRSIMILIASPEHDVIHHKIEPLIGKRCNGGPHPSHERCTVGSRPDLHFYRIGICYWTKTERFVVIGKARRHHLKEIIHADTQHRPCCEALDRARQGGLS